MVSQDTPRYQGKFNIKMSVYTREFLAAYLQFKNVNEFFLFPKRNYIICQTKT